MTTKIIFRERRALDPSPNVTQLRDGEHTIPIVVDFSLRFFLTSYYCIDSNLKEHISTLLVVASLPQIYYHYFYHHYKKEAKCQEGKSLQ